MTAADSDRLFSRTAILDDARVEAETVALVE
jgi:hypothetical protein